jgi:16S rRNA (cytosine967-C5)-methyltransferase
MHADATTARRAAYDAFARIRAGELADRALEAAAGELDPRDRAWTRELVYGTLRLRGRLDHLLGGLARGGLERLQPEVLDVLRLGAYQLLEMGGVPAYAAVSQSVELVRAVGASRAAGVVNGILQNLRRGAGAATYPEDPVDHLVAWGSHPRWLVERWVARWGATEARALVEANNRRPELYVTPLGIPAGEAVERLAGAGIAGELVAWAPDSVRILPPATARDALAAIPSVVQDPAAALVVRYAAVPEGATVVDLCAAPGGKALALAERAARVVAADLSRGRLGRLRENVARVGREDRIGVVVADGRRPPFADADAVLLDAPCTGTGTFRRHPDGRWRVGTADLAALGALQDALLAAASRVVRPGGLLIYSTCSLEPEENEVRIEAFLDAHPGWGVEPAPAAVDGALLDRAGMLRVLPQTHGVDGSFAARLRSPG